MSTRPRGLVLNGTSSAGKSSLARALQDRWDTPLVDGGLDRHLAQLPRRYLGADWPEIYTYRYSADGTIDQITVGPVGRRLYRAMHRSAAASAECGLDVVLDHVLLDRESAVELARSLHCVPAALIGVRCDEPVLSQREAQRAERTLGQAAAQLPIVHAHGAYDLVVDTATLDVDQAADAVMRWVESGPDLTALERLRS